MSMFKHRKIVGIIVVLAFFFGTLVPVSTTETQSAAISSKVSNAYKKKVETVRNSSSGASVTWTTFSVSGASNPLLAISVRIASDTNYLTVYHYVSGKVKKLSKYNVSGGNLKKYKNYYMISCGHDSLIYGAVIYRYKKGKVKRVAKKEKWVDGIGSVKKMEKKACKACGVNWKSFKKIRV